MITKAIILTGVSILTYWISIGFTKEYPVIKEQINISADTLDIFTDTIEIYAGRFDTVPESAPKSAFETLFDYCVNRIPVGVYFSNFKGNTRQAACLDIIDNVEALVPVYVTQVGQERVINEFCNAEGMTSSDKFTCTSAAR